MPAAKPTSNTLAVDADLLLHPATRRFLCAMQELSGGVLLATQATMRDAYERADELAALAAANLLRRLTPQGAPAPLLAAQEAARRTLVWRQWLLREKNRRSTASWRQGPALRQAVPLQAALLLRSHAFCADEKGAGRHALGVAEALLHGAHGMALHPATPIRIEMLNEWLARPDDPRTLPPEPPVPFALTGDAAVLRRTRQTRQEDWGLSACRWAAGACPTEDHASSDTLNHALRHFLDGLAQGGLPATAEHAVHTLDALQQAQPQDWPETLHILRAVANRAGAPLRKTPRPPATLQLVATKHPDRA